MRPAAQYRTPAGKRAVDLEVLLSVGLEEGGPVVEAWGKAQIEGAKPTVSLTQMYEASLSEFFHYES